MTETRRFVPQRRRRRTTAKTRGELVWFQAAKAEWDSFEPKPYISLRERERQKLDGYREQAVELFQKYNPNKADAVDKLMEGKYKDRLEDLVADLKKKYEDTRGFPPSGGTGPIVFLEISYPGLEENESSATVCIEIQLFADTAPLAAENFRRLCTSQVPGLNYVGNHFHRIVPNMCVQGGDITAGDGTGGKSAYSGPDEKTDMWGNFPDDKPFVAHDIPGLLSMANNGPNMNGSQFFFTAAAVPHLNGKHVVFGRVIKGLDHVLAMNRLPTDENQKPEGSVVIQDCGQIETTEDGTRNYTRASEKIRKDTLSVAPKLDCKWRGQLAF